jgi:hypothetical protein
MRMKKIWAGMVSLIALTAVVQAATIVNWGAPGGDTNIVTSGASKGAAAGATYALVSPDGTSGGYDLLAAGQTRTFYGASTGWNNTLVNNGVPDYMQLVSNFGGNLGTNNTMLAWESPNFLTTDNELENMTVRYESRGGVGVTATFLIETGAGWYQSNESDFNSSTSVPQDWTLGVGALTWSPFSEFGVTPGVGAADTNDIQSVGAYFSGVNSLGNNWAGTKVEYFNVTATGGLGGNQAPIAHAQSVSLVENTFLDITLTGFDPEGSNLTYSVVDMPTDGVLNGATNIWTYTPDTNYTGPDSFTFTVNDGETNSEPATISIDVNPDITIWENDMSTHPVGDDWVYRAAPGDLGGATVSNGVLTIVKVGSQSERIDSDPMNDFLGITKLDLVWRSITVGSDGSKERSAAVFVNVAGDAPADAAGLHFHATLTATNAQTFRIFNGGTELVAIAGFDGSMLTLEAYLDGHADTIDYIIGDGTTTVTGSVGFVANLKPVAPTLATMLSFFGTAEFDYIRIEVGATPPVVLAPYEAWVLLYELEGVDALQGSDVEPDGLNNLGEYAFGGNPTNDDAAAVSPDTYVEANWFYQVYNERADDTNLTFTVGATSDLTTPADTNDVFFVGASAVVDGYRTVTNRTEATTDEKFIDLEVSQ